MIAVPNASTATETSAMPGAIVDAVVPNNEKRGTNKYNAVTKLNTPTAILPILILFKDTNANDKKSIDVPIPAIPFNSLLSSKFPNTLIALDNNRTAPASFTNALLILLKSFATLSNLNALNNAIVIRRPDKDAASNLIGTPISPVYSPNLSIALERV